MKKRIKKILVIVIFILLGSVIGYFVVKTQATQLQDPQYLEFWTRNNMPIPEPLSYSESVIGFAMLFGGIPTGFIMLKYTINRISMKESVKAGWVFLVEILLFPIYIVIGSVGILPVLIYQIVKCVAKD